MSTQSAERPTPAAFDLHMLGVRLHYLVREATVCGFAKARARTWKDFLFDGRTDLRKTLDEAFKSEPNSHVSQQVQDFAEQIVTAIKAEIAYQVKAQLAGREGGHGHP